MDGNSMKMIYRIKEFFYKLKAFVRITWKLRKVSWEYIPDDYIVPIQFFYITLKDLYEEMEKNKYIISYPEGTLNDMRQVLKSLRRLSEYKYFEMAVRLSKDKTDEKFRKYLEVEREIEIKDLKKVFNEELAEKILHWWI